MTYPYSETQETQLVTLTDPTAIPAGYSFDGWCRQSDLSDASVSSLPAGIYGDIDLYANFLPNQYTVMLNAGGSLTENKVTLTFGENFTLPVPVRGAIRSADGSSSTERRSRTGRANLSASSEKKCSALFPRAPFSWLPAGRAGIPRLHSRPQGCRLFRNRLPCLSKRKSDNSLQPSCASQEGCLRLHGRQAFLL